MKQLQHKLTTSFKILLFVAINLLSITQANARSWRVEQIPNGNKFNCLNCHYAPYGGPRNSFGVEVESVVGRGSNDSFWNSVLAAKDSDGDGSSNGEEPMEMANRLIGLISPILVIQKVPPPNRYWCWRR